MSGETDCAIRQDLHSLIAAERLKVAEIQLKSVTVGGNDFLNLAAICISPVRSKTHDFAFITVLAVPDEFANHGVKASERVRKENAIEDVNLITLAPSGHR